MTSNSAIRAIFFLALTLALGTPGGAAETNTVTALAKLNGRTKEIDGSTFHLVAVEYDWRLNLLNSDARAPFWLFNGKLESEVVRKVELAEMPAGKLPPGVLLLWMKLPEQGNIEVLYGALRFDKSLKDPAVLRQRLTGAGYVPYTLPVDKAPTLQAETSETLATKLKEISSQGKSGK